ncbi:hypothetical protein KCU71_g44, partial [Aureobasidium melanogenum]
MDDLQLHGHKGVTATNSLNRPDSENYTKKRSENNRRIMDIAYLLFCPAKPKIAPVNDEDVNQSLYEADPVTMPDASRLNGILPIRDISEVTQDGQGIVSKERMGPCSKRLNRGLRGSSGSFGGIQ